jgi:outer membrane lipoprotein-sorting protein
MSKRIFMLVLCLGVALGISLACAAETVESVEGTITKLWDKVDAYTAKVVMTTNMEQGGMAMKMEGKGISECMKKGEFLLYRLELTNKMKMGEHSMDQKILSVFDGQWLYTQMDIMGMPMAFKMKPSISSGMVPGSGKAMFKMLHENFDVKIAPEEEVDGKAAYVFLMKPKKPAEKGTMPGMPSGFDNVKACFSKETGIQVMVAMLNTEGKPVFTIKYEEIKLNPTLSADRFTYTAPEGVKVMDVKDLGKMMGGAK